MTKKDEACLVDDESDCTFCTTPPSAGWKPRALQLTALFALWIFFYIVNALFIKDVSLAMISGFFICLMNIRLGKKITAYFSKS